MASRGNILRLRGNSDSGSSDSGSSGDDSGDSSDSGDGEDIGWTDEVL